MPSLLCFYCFMCYFIYLDAEKFPRNDNSMLDNRVITSGYWAKLLREPGTDCCW